MPSDFSFVGLSMMRYKIKAPVNDKVILIFRPKKSGHQQKNMIGIGCHREEGSVICIDGKNIKTYVREETKAIRHVMG